jgi:glycosyltransferase involved in cell wall biosynthesis
MKLLYIVPNVNNEGGVARVLSIKTNYFLEKLGYEVHILTQNKGNSTLFYSFSDKIIFHDIILEGSVFQFINSYRKALKNKIKAISPDIILICDNGLKAFTIPFILKTKIPIIFESHGSKFIEENQKNKLQFLTKLKLLFKDYSANKFTKFVALSNESLKEWNVKNGVIITNPLWFETNQFSDLKSKRVIAVSRHSYEKGLDRLLLIWQKVVEIHPEWMLDIYGRSNPNVGLQKLVQSLNISNNVTFYEPVKDINYKYLDASIYVMTSHYEGFPMVLIEAMAMGLPCVAYDCPCGPRAIIQNNENGFLVENGNLDSFIQKIELLIKDDNCRIQMGVNAQKSTQKYNLEFIMQHWKLLFESMV